MKKQFNMLVMNVFLFLCLPLSVTAQDLETYSHKLSQSTSAYQFWTAPPSERIFKDSAVPTEIGSEVKLYAAKNESEPFQIIVKPASSGSVTINVEDFGSGITTELYQVKYVNITQATDSLGKTGYYPDPLWPLEKGASVSLSANQNTAFWFDIYVPKTTPSGNYTKNVQIGGVNIPVKLHVFNFAIPDELHVKSQMNFGYQTLLTKYGVSGTGDNYWFYVNKIKQFFMDHRLTPSAPLWSGGLTSNGGGPYIDYDCSNGTLTDTDGVWGFEDPAAVYGASKTLPPNISAEAHSETRSAIPRLWLPHFRIMKLRQIRDPRHSAIRLVEAGTGTSQIIRIPLIIRSGSPISNPYRII